MNKTVFTILFLLYFSSSFAQTEETKYYSSRTSDKEVSQSKAKYSRTVTTSSDGVETRVLKDLKTNKIVGVSARKGDERVGVWISIDGSDSSRRDYDFPLIYTSDPGCSNQGTLEAVKIFFQDNAAIGYTAPKLVGYTGLGQLFAVNLVYDSKAHKENIQGKVYTAFTITAEGVIENVVVTKGVHVLLDKEAVRLVRMIKFSTPPILNGQPQRLCAVLPVGFSLK